jgi:Tfp pilus assembly protein PilW
MTRRLRSLLRDERGTTLPELMIGLSTGLVVMVGLTTLTMTTLHTTARVSTRVDATQRSRLTLTRVVDQLHSACIAPKVPPIRKESTGSSMRFIHANGSAVSPVPTLSVITLSGTTLTQYDYSWKEGTAPFWIFNSTPSKTIPLMTHVTQMTPTRPVFTYYGSAAGAISPTPLVTPLSEIDASRTIHVSIGLKTAPTDGPNSNDFTPSRIQGSATLRLTAPSYNKEAPSLPCQ